MNHTEGMFQGVGGLQLYYQSWQPDETPVAVVAIVHGIGDHGGRYMNLVMPLLGDGYAVYALDQRGHGRSPGKRGYINNWAEFRGDVGAFLHLIGRQQPEAPLILFGHSMGGLVALDYGLHHPDGLSGLIASAPALGTSGVPPVLLVLARLLSRIWPTLSLNPGLDINGISRDPEVVRASQADPLVHRKGTPRLATEVTRIIDLVHANAADFRLPLLVYHGSADRLTPPAASRAFFDQVPISDKKYITYEGGYHESHNDLHHAQTAADVAAWLNEHR